MSDPTNTQAPAPVQVASTESAAPAAPAPQAAPARPASPYASRPASRVADPPVAAAPAAAAPEAPKSPRENNRAALKANKELATARARIAELEPLAAREANSTKALATHAASVLAELSEGDRDTVLDLAGKDPVRQIEVLASLRKRGKIGASTAALPQAPSATTGHAPDNGGTRAPAADADSTFLTQVETLLNSDKTRDRMAGKALAAANSARLERARAMRGAASKN